MNSEVGGEENMQVINPTTVTMLAKRVSLSEQAIARMLRSGEIKGEKFARDWRIAESEAERVEKEYPLVETR